MARYANWRGGKTKMSSITQDKIETRITTMRAELSAFIEQANRTIAAQEGAIHALETLLSDLNGDAQDEGE